MSNRPYLFDIKKIKNKSDNKKILLTKSKNNKFKKDFSPLSGAERDYNPNLWNKNDKIRETHNCYSYALGKIVKKLNSKAQPGYASGFSHIEDDDYDCNEFKKRLQKDSPGSYLEKFDNACLPGFYKIFLALDVKNDYHWWVQNKNKYWSHKPGATNVIDIDGSGKKIKNPVLSNRKFKHRDYHKPCFFACVYSDLTRSIDEIYSQ